MTTKSERATTENMQELMADDLTAMTGGSEQLTLNFAIVHYQYQQQGAD